jgi:hypothetical protein
MKKRQYVEDDDGPQFKKPTTSSTAQFEDNSLEELDPDLISKMLEETPPVRRKILYEKISTNLQI